MKKFLFSIPTWVLSVVFTLIAAFLLLDEDPVSLDESFLFKGIDKVAHVILFFVLTCVYLYDYSRYIRPHHTKTGIELAFSSLAALVGLMLEIGQLALNTGRSFEVGDIYADLVGVVLGFLFMHFFMLRYLRRLMYHSHGHHHHHHHRHHHHHHHHH